MTQSHKQVIAAIDFNDIKKAFTTVACNICAGNEASHRSNSVCNIIFKVSVRKIFFNINVAYIFAIRHSLSSAANAAAKNSCIKNEKDRKIVCAPLINFRGEMSRSSHCLLLHDF